ncbi:MAG TPA: TonB-dependent receptor, partial [Myxococcota bacterium]|nr:TonB-dependent receptor [Myxococcota bacterium]
FGLRPNIGLRGASSERSSKVTLLEDGILFAPAPYSAAAAYYFPLITRMIAVEVFKGPAAIPYGPHTIGGALNLVTRTIPEGPKGTLDVAIGAYQSGKLHGSYGWGSPTWGFLLEGVRLQSTGFKVLDGGGETGFAKDEAMLKARWSTAEGETRHALQLKLGYADEVSNETYLGLSGDDFARTPYRRYAASRNDRMAWGRTQGQVSYSLRLGEGFELRAVVYRHGMHRIWRKMNRFAGISFESVLAAPGAGQNAVYHSVLTGDSDASGGNDTLMYGTNDRAFISQGAELTGTWRSDGAVAQRLSFGARLHEDWIDRRHAEEGRLMLRGQLISDGTRRDTAVNKARTVAGSFFARDEVALGAWTLTPGSRVEAIWTEFIDHQAAGAPARRQSVTALPGAGLHWQALPGLGAFVGVHRGFSPVTPGQATQTRPELSWNYEGGARLAAGRLKGSAVAFFNDYQNLLGECTFSQGCADEQVTQQFNGGRVSVYGVEADGAYEQPLHWDTTLHLALNYTWTRSRFLSSFTSDDPLFGRVEVGDELPYLPAHVGTLQAGLVRDPVSLDVSINYESDKRDVAGSGPLRDVERVPGRALVNLAARTAISEAGEVYLTVDNLLNTAYAGSRRPFGLRPGKPFTLMVGYKHWFE